MAIWRGWFIVLALFTAMPVHAQDATPTTTVENDETGAASESPPPMKRLRFEPIPLSRSTRIRNVVLATVGVTWFFWLGAALGSYLNVVVYRMPLGLNTVSPVSRCPRCETPIRPRDNVPILGWLLLRGRCRTCGEPISPRYVYVELLMGTIFLALLAFDVLSGDWYLPWTSRPRYQGMSVIEYFLQPRLMAHYFYHVAIAWFLTGIYLFRFDGNRVPRTYAIAFALALIVPPLLYPPLIFFWRS